MSKIRKFHHVVVDAEEHAEYPIARLCGNVMTLKDRLEIEDSCRDESGWEPAIHVSNVGTTIFPKVEIRCKTCQELLPLARLDDLEI